MSKLVRDRIPEIMRAKNQEAKVHIASKEEYVNALHTKLSEEVTEYLESKDKEELADILEVVYALGEAQGVAKAELESIRKEKADKRGGFTKRIILG